MLKVIPARRETSFVRAPPMEFVTKSYGDFDAKCCVGANVHLEAAGCRLGGNAVFRKYWTDRVAPGLMGQMALKSRFGVR